MCSLDKVCYPLMDGRFVRGGDTFLALCFKFLKAVYEKSKATRAKDKASILKLKATQKKRKARNIFLALRFFRCKGCIGELH